jgi:hypothetical protein
MRLRPVGNTYQVYQSRSKRHQDTIRFCQKFCQSLDTSTNSYQLILQLQFYQILEIRSPVRFSTNNVQMHKLLGTFSVEQLQLFLHKLII